MTPTLTQLGFTCFVTIMFIVFMSASQSFFLTDVLHSGDVGGDIGNLVFFDELVVLAGSPVAGALADKYIRPGMLQAMGIFIIGLGILFSTLATNVYPQLVASRMLFAVGACLATNMMIVMLHHLVYTVAGGTSGKLSSVVGVSGGLGAVFSVFGLLPIPTYFPERDPGVAAKLSYIIVGSFAMCVAFLLFVINLAHRAADEEQPLTDEMELDLSYFETLKLGFKTAKEDPLIQLSCIGSFVARTVTILSSVFVPLYVQRHFYDTGKCSDTSSRNHCPQAYILAAITTGVVQVVALVAAPVWGYAVDRLGGVQCAVSACILVCTGCVSIKLVGNAENSMTLLACCALGLGQIGMVITSMSIVSSYKKTKYNGAITGVYGLCGGLGILTISKLGGMLSHLSVSIPFILVGALSAFTAMYILLHHRSLIQSSTL